MRHITDDKNMQLHNTAVALGKFDGFHRGHQLLLSQVKTWQDRGMTGVIFTFRMPQTAVDGDNGKVVIQDKRIDSDIEKLHKAEMSGIDVFLEYPFTKEFSAQTPEEFVRNILIDKLHVGAVAIGADYQFGKDRSGDAETMRQLGAVYGFEVQVFEKLTHRGEEISSSAIRAAIQRGDMEFVTEAMGRGYSVYGKVVHGKELGRTIDIPTVNQSMDVHKLLAPYGVYAARCHRNTADGEEIIYGVSNLGEKPTVSSEHTVGLETHLLDYHGDLYGEYVEVELLHYIRPEKKFADLLQLTAQMKLDIQSARSYLTCLELS